MKFFYPFRPEIQARKRMVRSSIFMVTPRKFNSEWKPLKAVTVSPYRKPDRIVHHLPVPPWRTQGFPLTRSFSNRSFFGIGFISHQPTTNPKPKNWPQIFVFLFQKTCSLKPKFIFCWECSPPTGFLKRARYCTFLVVW